MSTHFVHESIKAICFTPWTFLLSFEVFSTHGKRVHEFALLFVFSQISHEKCGPVQNTQETAFVGMSAGERDSANHDDVRFETFELRIRFRTLFIQCACEISQTNISCSASCATPEHNKTQQKTCTTNFAQPPPLRLILPRV